MDTIVSIIQQLGKAGVVAGMFAGTLAVFELLERVSSKAAREDLINSLYERKSCR
jgi:hypothetical protein